MNKRNVENRLYCIIVILLAINLVSCNKPETSTDADDEVVISDIMDEDQNNELVEDMLAPGDAVYAYDSFFPFRTLWYNNNVEYDYEYVSPDYSINPEEVYENIDYEPVMFYGRYWQPDLCASGAELGIGKQIIDEATLVDASEIVPNMEKGYFSISTVPYAIDFGPIASHTYLNGDKTYEWATLHFLYKSSLTDKISYHLLSAAYEISDNKIVFNIVDSDSFERDENEMFIDYSFSGITLTYDFEFNGPTLKLYDDNMSSTMLSYSFVDQGENPQSEGFQQTFYAHDEYPSIPEISRIKMQYSVTKEYGIRTVFEVTYLDEDLLGCAVLYENGIIDICFKDNEGVNHSYRFLYFWIEDGIILTDGDNTYYYLSNWLCDMKENDFGYKYTANISEEDQGTYNELSEEQKGNIQKTRKQLLSELKDEFDKEGVEAEIDMDSGKITLDSAILFNTNDANLSANGEKTVEDFMRIFSRIIAKEEYDGFVKRIVVEGHTDSSGDDSINKPLSLARANSVLEKCLLSVSDDRERYYLFESLFEALGKGSDEVILNIDGTEDMDASRRVVFMIYININGLG